jgi:hypothetical protein
METNMGKTMTTPQPNNQNKMSPFQRALENFIDAAQLVHHDILSEPTWNPDYNVQLTLTVAEIRLLAAGTKRGREAAVKLLMTEKQRDRDYGQDQH